jgi:hypothetical protein
MTLVYDSVTALCVHILCIRFVSISSKVYWTGSKAGGELENPIDSKSNWNRKGAVVLYRERVGQTLITLIEGEGEKDTEKRKDGREARNREGLGGIMGGGKKEMDWVARRFLSSTIIH